VTIHFLQMQFKRDNKSANGDAAVNYRFELSLGVDVLLFTFLGDFTVGSVELGDSNV